MLSKKEFEAQCKKLEANGWSLVEYEPARRYAVYTNGYAQARVG